MRACGKCRDPCALKFRPIIPHQKKMMGNPMMKAMGQMMQAMKSGGGMDMMMTMGDADNEITA